MPTLVPRPGGQDGDARQLVSPAAQAVYAYDPANGEELWKVRHSGWSIAPRAVYGQGLIFVVVDHDHPELWAVRPDGVGDVTESHVEWKATQGMPARSSPLLVGDLLFVVSHGGVATCLDATTGEPVWKKRIEGKYSASAFSAGGRVYFFNEDAICTVVKAARQFEVLSINQLAEEQLMASPAVAGDSLFVRTENHLYRIDDLSSQ
ncbi:MAG: PQQ-binding-like beta-propeller repeat protein [Pirellulales bacterium]